MPQIRVKLDPQLHKRVKMLAVENDISLINLIPWLLGVATSYKIEEEIRPPEHEKGVVAVMRQLRIKLDPTLHKRLKILAVENDISLINLIPWLLGVATSYKIEEEESKSQ